MSADRATAAFLESVASGDWGGVRAALAGGANVLGRNLSGHNALALALVHGPEDLALAVFGLLVGQRPGLEWMSDTVAGSGARVLDLMVQHQRYRVLSAALGLGDDVLARLGQSSVSGGTLAHLAVMENTPRALSMLLKACPGLATSRSSFHLSPLELAVKMDKERLVDVLVNAGAGISEGPRPAWTQVGSMAMLDYLSPHVDWEVARAHEGQTLSHVLVSRGKELKGQFWRAIHKRFPSHSVVLDDQGRSPLHVAIRANASVEVINNLVDAGARWTQEDKSGDTPQSLLFQQLSSGWKVPTSVVDEWTAQARAHVLDGRLGPAIPSSDPVRL